MDRAGGYLPLDPIFLSEQLHRVSSWKTTRLLRRVLPQPLIERLRDVKLRVLSSGLSRDREWEQSLVDAESSAPMSIVVPIHDAPTVTRRCLASLEKFAPQSEIILVDDASKEVATLEVISSFVNRNSWRVVRHEKALGHSGACKAGADLATRPYLCLLNSDTVVTPWCWRLVEEVFERDPLTGVAGPSTSCTYNDQSSSYAYPLRHYWNENQICGFAKRLLTDTTDPAVVDLPWVAGFAFFIRRNLWEQLGGFDPNLPDYGNEVELCKRIWAKGYRTVWIRKSYIHHLGSESYRQTIGAEAIVARSQAAEIYTEQRHSTHS